MAARQTVSRGRGAMGSPSPSASSRERLPHRVSEIPAQMGEAHDSVLGAVHAARQRRHQGDGGNDAHDLPGAEAETPLAGGIEGAGHRVPDQQEPRQRQHPAIEHKQHVAQHGAATRADIAEKGQHVPRRPVGAGKQAMIDGLCRRRFRQQQARDTYADKCGTGEQDQNADTGKGTLLPWQTWPFFGSGISGFIFLRFLICGVR